MAGQPAYFDQLVLAGGGTRCFWQGGFLHVVETEVGLESVRRLSAISGGVLTACGHVAHIGERILNVSKDVFGQYNSNIDLASKVGGWTPHEEAYREILERCFHEEERRAVAEGPSVEVILSGLPDGIWDEISIAASHSLYLLDRLIRSSTTKKLTKFSGIEETRVRADKAAAEGCLIDLIATASRVPPIFDIDHWNGQRVMDGGAIDDAPFPEPDEGTSLVLLTAHFRDLPEAAGRVFVMPCERVPTDTIDFTEPEELDAAWKAGEESGRAFLELWRRGEVTDSEPLRC